MTPTQNKFLFHVSREFILHTVECYFCKMPVHRLRARYYMLYLTDIPERALDSAKTILDRMEEFHNLTNSDVKWKELEGLLSLFTTSVANEISRETTP